jgi:hypothetical protein
MVQQERFKEDNPMKLLRRSPLLGAIGIILGTILFLTTVCIHRYTTYIEVQNSKESLFITVAKMSNSTEEESTTKPTTTTTTTVCEETTTQSQEQTNESQSQTKEEKTTESSTKPYVNTTDFKSYMPYTAITNKSSKQYKLQQQAYTDENGLRCIDNKPMVAVGTGWGLSVGDVALVICENGNSFEVVVGDIKDDRDTKSDNKTTSANNCRCEFIVDMSELNSTVKRSGNIAVLEEYKGYVTNVKKIG